VAAIGFSMVSCKDDDGGSGSLTITGLDKYNGKYVVAWGGNDADTLNLVAADSINLKKFTAKGAKISNGKATLNVWTAGGTDENPTISDYNGSDTVVFGVIITDKADLNLEDEDGEEAGMVTAIFNKGIGVGALVVGS